MAIILIEGFDHEAGNNGSFQQGGSGGIAYKGWGSPFYSFVTGRFPQSTRSAAIQIIANNPIQKFFVPTSPVIIGFAYRYDGGNPVPITISGLGQKAASIALDFAQRLTIRDTGDNVLATGTTEMLSGVWNYIEVKLTVGNPGTCIVHVNGGPEIGSTSGNFGTILADEISMTWGGNALNICSYDDIYVADTTGPAPNNNFLGDVRVETLYPSSDGTHVDWTPDTGVVHFSRVNEAQIDSDTSYVSATTVGNLDSYVFQDLTGVGTVYAAQLNLGVRKNDAIVRQVAPLIRQSGTDYIGGTFTINGSYQFWSTIYNTDPTGTGWTVPSIDNDEYGIKLVA